MSMKKAMYYQPLDSWYLLETKKSRPMRDETFARGSTLLIAKKAINSRRLTHG